MQNDILVAANDTRSLEEIKRDAINEIEDFTGFYRKDTYKANAISIPFEIKLKNNGLKSRDGYDIFREFLKENDQKPVVNVHEKVDILINEKVHGITYGVCPDCGKKIFAHAKFCTYCGEEIGEKYRFS